MWDKLLVIVKPVVDERGAIDLLNKGEFVDAIEAFSNLLKDGADKDIRRSQK